MKTDVSISHKALELLERACRHKANSSRATWALAAAALGLGSLLLAAVADYWVLLSWPLRSGAALIIFGLTGYGLVRLAQCLRRKPALKEAALDLETAHPQAGCIVSTAAEYLSGTRKPDQAYEPELAAALQRQAARFLGAWRLPYWRRVRFPALAFGCTILGLFIFLLASTGPWTAFKRVTTPWTRAVYTSVRVEPGDAQVPIGKDFALKSSFAGRLPVKATLHWRSIGAAVWHQVELKLGETGTWDYTLKDIRQSVEYYVTGGDGRSRNYRVEAYIPPEVKKLGVTVQLPAYTRRASRKFASPDLQVLRASVADFVIEPTVPLSKGRLRFAKGAPIDLAPAANGTWTGQLEIRQDDEYWIELFDQKNRLGSNDQPYSIRALPDEPPKVEIVQPGQDIRADTNQHIAIKIHAVDDYGLREMRLVYNKLGQPAHTLPIVGRTSRLPSLSPPSAAEMPEASATSAPFVNTSASPETAGEPSNAMRLEDQADLELPLAELELKDYELVAYHAEAVDNNTLDGPGIGKSPVYFIEITDKEGSVCHSQCNSAKVNLLVIQKQIIADTEALAENAPAEQFRELAGREKEVIDFAGMYLNGLAEAGAPASASTEMRQSIQALGKAKAYLDQQQRQAALPPEESALAHFYQVIKLLPELENLPTKPPAAMANASQNSVLKVVLETIKKQKKEQPDNKELSELQRQVQQLSRSEANLAQSAQSLGGARQVSSSRATETAGSSATPETQDAKPDQNARAQAASQSQDASAQESAALANRQEQLSQEAAALLEKLAKLAGHDHRLGHDIPKSMSTAAQKLSSASGALRQGNLRSGYHFALEGSYALSTVSALLQRILSDGGALADVSAEEYPKEYEKPIAEYFKQLSRQE